MKQLKLLKLSIEEAEKKYPNGYNKLQLIEISKEIKKKKKITEPIWFGKIENNTDIVLQRNNMIAGGHYGAGITDCEVVGINGDCGSECPVFKLGDCKTEDKDAFIKLIKETKLNEHELKEIYNLYPHLKP